MALPSPYAAALLALLMLASESAFAPATAATNAAAPAPAIASAPGRSTGAPSVSAAGAGAGAGAGVNAPQRRAAAPAAPARSPYIVSAPGPSPSAAPSSPPVPADAPTAAPTANAPVGGETGISGPSPALLPLALTVDSRSPTGASENDIRFGHPPPVQTHVEAQEEEDNHIADPRPTLYPVPSTASSPTALPTSTVPPVTSRPSDPASPADQAVPSFAPITVPTSTSAPASTAPAAATSSIPTDPVETVVPSSPSIPSTSSTIPTPSTDTTTSAGSPTAPAPHQRNGNADEATTTATEMPATDSPVVATTGESLDEGTTEADVTASPATPATPAAPAAPHDADAPPGWAWQNASAPAHPCARDCVLGAPPMRCYYRFHVESYYAMSKACYDCPGVGEDCSLPHCIAADGVKRGVTVVNRQMPGPPIEVCVGDEIAVDLHNGLVAETTSIHWHGHHQRGTPYMDGVPLVTQCPVSPASTFRYRFSADAPGTHFWHSHSGHQRADGMFGALVVRVPRQRDAHASLYDRDEREHTLHVLDWGADGGAERFLAHHHADGPNKPSSMLVNGRGRVLPGGVQGDDPPPVAAPEFRVQKGLRYRFRLINAGFLNCPVELSVDNHTLLVIASDGFDIRPVPATSLVSYAGERFDFVIEANASVSAYWMRFRGLLDCDERFTSVHQVAVLRYEGADEATEPAGELTYANAHRPGHQVNSFNVGEGTGGSTVVSELEALEDDDESLKAEPDFRFYLAYDFYALDNPHFHKAPHYGFYNVTSQTKRVFTPQFNHVSMKMLPFPMLSQRDQLHEGLFCNASTVAGPREECRDAYCECTHVLQLPLNAVVELILIDEGVTYDANHPFHLHGHAFRVVALQRLGSNTSLEEVKRLDAAGAIPRRLSRAPLKDTCTVPDGGFTILRLRASNPGYWLFHCHIEFHVEIGMALVFKIGDDSQMSPVPKGFPRCGDWLPNPDADLEMPDTSAAPRPAPAFGLMALVGLMAAMRSLPS